MSPLITTQVGSAAFNLLIILAAKPHLFWHTTGGWLGWLEPVTSEVGRKVVMMGGGQVCIVAIPNGEIRAIEHMLMPQNGFFIDDLSSEKPWVVDLL